MISFGSDIDYSDSEVTLDITPLIDVVFLLLIFFMVTTTFDESPSIKVDLPKASSSKATSTQTQLVIAVDAQGKFYTNDKQVSEQELTKELIASKEKSDMVLIVRADENARHKDVVKVLYLIKSAAIPTAAIATKPN
jgi:biopolymer transport protein ExbD